MTLPILVSDTRVATNIGAAKMWMYTNALHKKKGGKQLVYRRGYGAIILCVMQA